MIMESEPLRPGRDAAPPHGAGAYGFSRVELRGLIVFGILTGGLIIYQWFHRQSEQSVPAWVIEDVVISSPPSPSSREPSTSASEGAGSAANDSVFLQPDKKQHEDIADPGHVLVDVNTATQRELVRLPGIGPALAGRIVADREKKGPFKDLRDLERVRGIGPKTAAALAGSIRFSSVRTPGADTSGAP